MSSPRTLVGISVFWFALSLLFDGMTVLVLPIVLVGAMEGGGGPSALGLVTFAGLFAAMLVQPLAGWMSDRLRPRLGRRPVLAFGTVAILAALGLFGIGASAGAVTVIALGYLAMQVAGSAAQAAQQGFIPDLVPKQTRGRAAGLKAAMDVGGAFVAFLVLGTLIEERGIPATLIVVAGIVVASFLVTAALVREHRDVEGGGAVEISAPGAGDPRVAIASERPPSFGWLVVSRFLFLLATYAIGRFFLFFVAERLGLDPASAAAEAGGLLAGLTLLTVIAAVPAGWAADRIGRSRLMVGGAAISVVGALLLTGASAPWQILVFGGLLSIGSAAFVGANWAATTDVVPPEAAARYMGIANIGTAGAAAVAGLSGLLVDMASRAGLGDGYEVLFASCAVLFALSALALRGIAPDRTPAGRIAAAEGAVGRS